MMKKFKLYCCLVGGLGGFGVVPPPGGLEPPPGGLEPPPGGLEPPPGGLLPPPSPIPPPGAFGLCLAIA